MDKPTKEKVNIYVNAKECHGSLRHIWGFIGYDEINYTTTPSGEETLKKFEEFMEKPYYIRVHHLLCTGNCRGTYKWGSTNVYYEDENGQPIYNWKIIDEIFDTILKYKFKPFVELGFMPEDLVDSRCQVSYNDGGWAYPPKDYSKWYDLIFELVKHLIERYGKKEVITWYFELWNEPNFDYYWKGTFEEFCKLYDYTAAAIENVLPTAMLGGPSILTPGTMDNADKWLDNFLAHCSEGKNYYTGEKGTKLDYVTYHVKGIRYQKKAIRYNVKKETPSLRKLLFQVESGVNIIKKHLSLEGLYINLSECDPDGWAAGGVWDNKNLEFRNTEYYSSFVAACFKYLLDIQRKYKCDIDAITWAFMFIGERCFEGTRTFTTLGVDKPILNLFRMLSLLGKTRISLKSTHELDPISYISGQGIDKRPNIDGMASMSDNSIQILLFNHHDDWDVSGEYDVNIRVDNFPFNSSQVKISHYRIDKNYSNAYTEWVRQGCPNFPKNDQLKVIKNKEMLELVEPEKKMKIANEMIKKKISIPVHGVSLLIIRAL